MVTHLSMLLFLLQTIFVKKWGKVAAVHNRLVDRLFHLRGAEAERKIRGRREQQRRVAVAEGKRLEEALRRTKKKVAAIDEKIGEEVQDLGREVVATTRWPRSTTRPIPRRFRSRR